MCTGVRFQTRDAARARKMTPLPRMNLTPRGSSYECEASLSFSNGVAGLRLEADGGKLIVECRGEPPPAIVSDLKRYR
jgi:hypothetical protein